MPVGVLLMTHDGVASALLDCATGLFGEPAAPVEILEVTLDADVEGADAAACVICDRIDEGEGLLILTDLHGATPANIACDVADRRRFAVLSGLNMPMLARLFTYRLSPYEELRDKLISAATEGAVAMENGKGVA